MRKVIRVNPKTHMMCIPNEIAEDGMVGDVESYPNAVTLTLVMPGADLHDAESSLERTLDDIRHRMRFEEKMKDNPVGQEKKRTKSFDELRAKLKGVENG